MIIAFDCVGAKASCAVRFGEFYQEHTFANNLSQTVSSDLIPMLIDLARAAGKSLGDVRVVATSTGPGSFTGIRLGLATALGLHQATGCVLFTPTTLDVWCFEGWGQTSQPTLAAIDSKRGDYFAQQVDADFKITHPPHVLGVLPLEGNIITDVASMPKALMDYYDYCAQNNRVSTNAEPFYLRTPTFVKQKRYEAD